MRRIALAGLLLALSLAGCSVGGGTAGTTPGATSTSTATRQLPAPVRTIVRAYPTYRAGQTGVVRAPAQHASLRVTVSRPSVSRTRLSSSYGYPPARGRYVTFRVTVVDTGKVAVDVRRLDFAVRTPGAPRTTTDDGNSPYSGSGSQLDTTELSPGQRVSNDLTFDVHTASGTLRYSPDGKTALAWTF